MVYISPYRYSDAKPPTAHLDGALQAFIRDGVAELSARGIKDVWAGTENEFFLLDPNPYQKKHSERRKDLRERLKAHLSEVVASQDFADETPRMLDELQGFEKQDVLMARLHLMSAQREKMLPNFGWDFQDAPGVYEVATVPVGVADLQATHHGIVNEISKSSKLYGFHAEFANRHLSNSAKIEGQNIFDPNSDHYWGYGKRVTELQLKALHEIQALLISPQWMMNLAEDDDLTTCCSRYKNAPMRNRAGTNELRRRATYPALDHLNFVVASFVVAPMLAAARELDVAWVCEANAPPIFRAEYAIATEQDKKDMKLLLALLEQTAFEPVAGRPEIYVPLLNDDRIDYYLHGPKRENGLLDAIGYKEVNEDNVHEFMRRTYIEQKGDGTAVIRWPDDPKSVNRGTFKPQTNQKVLEKRQAIEVSALHSMYQIYPGYDNLDIRADGTPEKVGGAFARRFKESELFRQTMPAELFEAIGAAADRAPELFVAEGKAAAERSKQTAYLRS